MMTNEESTQYAIDCFARALRRRVGDGRPWVLAFFDTEILRQASDEWFTRVHNESQHDLDAKLVAINAASEQMPHWLDH